MFPIGYVFVDLHVMRFDRTETIDKDVFLNYMHKIRDNVTKDLENNITQDLTIFVRGSFTVLSQIAHTLRKMGFDCSQCLHVYVHDKNPRTRAHHLRNHMEHILIARAGSHKRQKLKEVQNFFLTCRVPSYTVVSLGNKNFSHQLHQSAMKHLCDKITQHRSTVVVVHAGLGNLLPPLIDNDCSVVAIHENQELSEKAHVEVTNFNSFQGDKLKTYFEVAFHPQLSHNSPLCGFGHHWLTIGRQTDAPSAPVETEHMQEDQDEKDAQNETQVSAKPGESHIDVILNILLIESLTVVVRSGTAKPLTVTSPSKVILAPKTSDVGRHLAGNLTF